MKGGTIFTHRRPTAPDQRPERDFQSTSYLAAIVSSEEFGPMLRDDAIRHGMGRAKTVVFLGDGAVWVWKLARLNFPGVVEAGCKVVVGQRLKQSGMLWSRKGAEHPLAIRCALLSGWFQDF